jgi:AraC family transcriptional regulator of adaptative response/methylated-DNA-[protein]-cysteine methyltransferase
MKIYAQFIKTPIGLMYAGCTDDAICLFDFVTRQHAAKAINRIKTLLQAPMETENHPLLSELERQVAAYFAGTLQLFDLPLHPVGTPFQQEVWHTLQTIPYGTTITYKQQALRMGNEKLIRAMAHANGANTLAILIPCHRVIGSSGSLIGYAGGLHLKKWLLQHEHQYAPQPVEGQLPLFF